MSRFSASAATFLHAPEEPAAGVTAHPGWRTGRPRGRAPGLATRRLRAGRDTELGHQRMARAASRVAPALRLLRAGRGPTDRDPAAGMAESGLQSPERGHEPAGRLLLGPARPHTTSPCRRQQRVDTRTARSARPCWHIGLPTLRPHWPAWITCRGTHCPSAAFAPPFDVAQTKRSSGVKAEDNTRRTTSDTGTASDHRTRHQQAAHRSSTAPHRRRAMAYWIKHQSAMPTLPLNACRLCGATSYRRVLARDDAGALRPNGLYQCSGCSVVFADPASWRDGGPEAQAPVSTVKPLTPTQGASDAAAGPRLP